MNPLLVAGVTHGSVVVDLGSGDGVLLIAAAKRGAHAIGYELSRSMPYIPPCVLCLS